MALGIGKRVTIFTTFADYSEAYSLIRVVEDQLKMLISNGYEPMVIVTDSFVPKNTFAHPSVTLYKIPNVAVHNEIRSDENFDRDVEDIYKRLREALSMSDIILTHDIVYQNAALKHNFAARKAAVEFPNVRWLHWIHSATPPATLEQLRPYFVDAYLDLMKVPFPNSKFIFFNDYSIPRIAQMFATSENNVRIVHHPSDLSEVLGLTVDVTALCRDKKIFDADAICIYPIRLDRGKQVEHVIKTIAMLKTFDLSVKLVIVDFHSTGGDKVDYRDFLKTVAIDYGMNENEIIWTSEYKPEWNAEIPHEDVMSLMRLSNVFIMPSVSESYSLVTQEAGLNKDVLVLNFDFPPFRDIFGPNAIYRKYSSRIDVLNGMDGSTDTEYGNEKEYHRETAGMVAAKLLNENSLAMSIRLRKFRNLDYIFHHELEPLFYEEVKNG